MKRLRRQSRTDVRGSTALFFATDIHGSSVCFKKFLNAGRFYGAKHLVLGGDITGKTVVPVLKTPTGWKITYNDRTYADLTGQECSLHEAHIHERGQYTLRGEQDELLALDDEAHREQVFRRLVLEQMREWTELAAARLAGSDIGCFITPGNDDYFEIDTVLQDADAVEFVEGRCVRLDEEHEMITTGYSNPTPWDSPRELTEDALRERIETMFRDVSEPSRLIAVLHPPPHGTELDQAPMIDAELQLQSEGGSLRLGSVGSTAVREFILERQPLLGLHGHVHESSGIERLGRTTCINAGSEYTQGILTGALVRLRNGEVVSSQLVAG